MIRTIFCDIGGVLGTNGWDHVQRRAVLDVLGLDPVEFESRHEMVVTAFETGQLTLDQYLDRTVFYRERRFTREQFRERMFSQSQPFADSIALMGRLAKAGKWLLAILNNESDELNRHRIESFGLKDIFMFYLSSCYLGLLKPAPEIYERALQLTQKNPAECVFIDDRALNLECAASAGMHTVQFHSAPQLEAALFSLGVEV